MGSTGNELINNLNNTVDNYIKQGVDVKAIKRAINIVLNSVERKAVEHIQSSISENEEGTTDIETEVRNIIQDVAEGQATVEDAVFSIMNIAQFIGNYAHQTTLEPSMNEDAEEIDEERITNDEGKEFAKTKDNFIGSHCWGENLGDGSYVVMSYGKQFPLYIFWNKKNKWYENSDHYLYDGEPQESTEEHRRDLRPTEETRKKQADWMRKLSNHLLKVNGMSEYEHISVEPGTKN